MTTLINWFRLKLFLFLAPLYDEALKRSLQDLAKRMADSSQQTSVYFNEMQDFMRNMNKEMRTAESSTIEKIAILERIATVLERKAPDQRPVP